MGGLPFLIVSMAGQLYLFFPTDFYYPKPPSGNGENTNNPSFPSLQTPKTVLHQQPKALVHKNTQGEKLEKEPSSSIEHRVSSSHAEGRPRVYNRKEVQGKSAELPAETFLDWNSRTRAF
ncbi:hypothetical protein PVL29_010774 [Vitis rotundifolia]|uniref:Uncharacterized protein n=1 Tax=Vitis rotundifolia TaxID=103349 RepID=A0AA38ZUC7_VITRO|nr:hypothetical protein PVL29_010774 [Vitis rotundifolia]